MNPILMIILLGMLLSGVCVSIHTLLYGQMPMILLVLCGIINGCMSFKIVHSYYKWKNRKYMISGNDLKNL